MRFDDTFRTHFIGFWSLSKRLASNCSQSQVSWVNTKVRRSKDSDHLLQVGDQLAPSVELIEQASLDKIDGARKDAERSHYGQLGAE